MNDPTQTVDESERGQLPAVAVGPPPQHIGRYRVERLLGQGGFGIVYLAHDEQLQRFVAVKVPHRRLVSRPEDAEAYLSEARTVASLDHPHIVPVFDAGSTEEFPCFVVSKFIEGSTLAQRIKENRPSVAEAAELAATVAETLHYAHRQGLVHRDIKPGNILLDADGKPYVADFGLALREQDVGKGPRYAGTPAYMSPEQARGEGHRVDGRSDIFSLGVVLYELLTGRRPFHANSPEELLEQIANREARPPRQWDDTIPRELERICLKALSKRASERFTTAKDIADDLRHFLAEASAEEKSTVTGQVSHHAEAATPMPSPAPTSSDQQPIKIVPKGLRSFDAGDADFFLELLPGPRDREGLPDSIRFWKGRIEEMDPGNTFSVGLIYGPSGCGKSSLVKAGLLPRLAKSVTAVYVEATADETEARLLKGLRRQVPDLPPNLGLIEALAELRRGRSVASGHKLLLVLDQFEQWLHARRNEENPELVKALRQCDGGRLQCLVLVRDDFWMAATRFMRDLEIHLSEGQNSAAVDLFPIRHAEKVLAAFGRAFGALPEGGHSKSLDPSLQALVGRLEHLSGQYRELREGVQKAIQVADVDPEMALTRTRKVLEYVIRDVFERRVKDPPGTRPLENLLQRLVKDGHFPDRLDAYANTIRKLGNVGTHTFDEKVAAADVHQSLRQLLPILDWYFEVERPEAITGKPIVAPQPSRVLGNAPAASEEYQAFLEQAVSGLAQDGKVICVRLALFAEMMKGKSWTPTTLREVGGTEGIGVTFLEETFSATTAPPEHRYHQKAARAVLKALLPEAGTEIKGHMRSQQELREASGYASRPRDFEDLLRILDSELRLLTPTDPEGKEDADPSTVQADAKYYQLTHDYLVPSLRDWLTRKQKETRRGRAELLLADRATVWNARPENRQLPSLLQWLQIRWFTARRSWTRTQRKMMGKAGRYHAVRVITVILIGLICWELFRVGRADELVERVLEANTTDVPAIVNSMAPYRRWVNSWLYDAYAEAESNGDARKQLHVSLALLPVDPGQVDYLSNRLLDAQPHEFPVIRDALAPHKDKLREKFWAVVEAPPKGKESQRLRAAAALANYDSESERWTTAGSLVVNDLVRENAVFLGQWSAELRAVKNFLLLRLAEIFRDHRAEIASERSLATNLLADYAADQPRVLADLLMDADEKQFTVMYPKLKEQGEQCLPLLIGEIDKKLSSELPCSDKRREQLAKRQVNAAVALLKLKHPAKVWPLLARSKEPDDPRARSYLIHCLCPLGIDARAIIEHLNEEADVTIRRALILSLGEFGEKELSSATRQTELPKLQNIYRTAADPGLHGAAEWLLRQWKQETWLKQINKQWAKDKGQREQRQKEIEQALAKEKDKMPRWYVNSQGQTMVVIPGPVTFLMGSPSSEAGRDEDETQHKKRIGRTFALAAKPVTLEQYRQFDKHFQLKPDKLTRVADLPVVATSWHQAAEYCNWLSKEEGLDECYEIKEGRVIKMKASYLRLTGYRLPTEAEMEYAARAGALTSRYYGETEELLPKYAWYTKNSQEMTWPVGSLKPNDFGLFDIHGNVYTWCQDRSRKYLQGQEKLEDEEESYIVNNEEYRVLRGGGSYGDRASILRCANRGEYVPSVRYNDVGFRPARTLAP